VHLAAELCDGSTVIGETNISAVGPEISRIFLQPETCHPMPEALAAISSADLITIGPGSLFTSLLPPLLVHGVSDAIGNSNAVKVLVSNLMTQPGETSGFSAVRHVEEIAKYAPQIEFDHVVLNSEKITKEQQEAYALERSEQIGIEDGESIAESCGANIVYANLLSEGTMVRHDPAKLAEVVMSIGVGERV
jgi:uncharacterized cofD-like protein